MKKISEAQTESNGLTKSVHMRDLLFRKFLHRAAIIVPSTKPPVSLLFMWAARSYSDCLSAVIWKKGLFAVLPIALAMILFTPWTNADVEKTTGMNEHSKSFVVRWNISSSFLTLYDFYKKKMSTADTSMERFKDKSAYRSKSNI